MQDAGTVLKLIFHANFTQPQLALFCFAAGFGEELLFRGIVQQQLEQLVGISPAAIAVAVGFGCVFFSFIFLVRFSR